MKKYVKRISKLLFGIFLHATGISMGIQANVGLAPWDAFNIGISNITGLTYGSVNILSGIIILIIVSGFLKEKLGIGTICNTILIGTLVDLILSTKLIPFMNNFFLGTLMMVLSQTIVSFATYFYISPGLGCGPKDMLMVTLGKFFPKLQVGVLRGIVEGSALLIGFLLGAKVGIGTVISVFGISIIIQYTFKLLKFDISTVVHENIFESIDNIKKSYKKIPY